MFRLLVFVFDAWVLGFCMVFAFAVANVLFTRRVARFISQLQMGAIWPLALMSKAGRKTLIETFKGDFV